MILVGMVIIDVDGMYTITRLLVMVVYYVSFIDIFGVGWLM